MEYVTDDVSVAEELHRRHQCNGGERKRFGEPKQVVERWRVVPREMHRVRRAPMVRWQALQTVCATQRPSSTPSRIASWASRWASRRPVP